MSTSKDQIVPPLSPNLKEFGYDQYQHEFIETRLRQHQQHLPSQSPTSPPNNPLPNTTISEGVATPIVVESANRGKYSYMECDHPTDSHIKTLLKWGLTMEDVNTARRWCQEPHQTISEKVHMRFLAELAEEFSTWYGGTIFRFSDIESLREIYDKKMARYNFTLKDSYKYVARQRAEKAVLELIDAMHKAGCHSDEMRHASSVLEPGEEAWYLAIKEWSEIKLERIECQMERKRRAGEEIHNGVQESETTIMDILNAPPLTPKTPVSRRRIDLEYLDLKLLQEGDLKPWSNPPSPPHNPTPEVNVDGLDTKFDANVSTPKSDGAATPLFIQYPTGDYFYSDEAYNSHIKTLEDLGLSPKSIDYLRRCGQGGDSLREETIHMHLMADCARELGDNCHGSLKNINLRYVCEDYMRKIDEYNTTITPKHKDYAKNQMENELLKLLDVMVAAERGAVETRWVSSITRKEKDSVAMHWILKEWCKGRRRILEDEIKMHGPKPRIHPLDVYRHEINQVNEKDDRGVGVEEERREKKEINETVVEQETNGVGLREVVKDEVVEIQTDEPGVDDAMQEWVVDVQADDMAVKDGMQESVSEKATLNSSSKIHGQEIESQQKIPQITDTQISTSSMEETYEQTPPSLKTQECKSHANTKHGMLRLDSQNRMSDSQVNDISNMTRANFLSSPMLSTETTINSTSTTYSRKRTYTDGNGLNLNTDSTKRRRSTTTYV